MSTTAGTTTRTGGTAPTDRADVRPPTGPALRHRLGALAALVAAALVLVGLAAPAQAATTPTGSHRTALVAGTGAAVHGPLAYPRGYVTEGNLRKDPNKDTNNIILTIWNQWVEISCWIDGGNNGFNSNRWFKAHYYDKVGYLSAGVVSSQPSVGRC